jgi:hypothetical protein
MYLIDEHLMEVLLEYLCLDIIPFIYTRIKQKNADKVNVSA